MRMPDHFDRMAALDAKFGHDWRKPSRYDNCQTFGEAIALAFHTHGAPWIREFFEFEATYLDPRDHFSREGLTDAADELAKAGLITASKIVREQAALHPSMVDPS